MFDRTSDTAGSEVKEGPVVVGPQGGTADIHDGADGVTTLFLFEGIAETVDTGVTNAKKSECRRLLRPIQETREPGIALGPKEVPGR